MCDTGAKNLPIGYFFTRYSVIGEESKHGTMELKESLKDLVFSKSALKQDVYQSTKDTFEMFREETRELIRLFKERSRLKDATWPSSSPTAATSSSK